MEKMKNCILRNFKHAENGVWVTTELTYKTMDFESKLIPGNLTEEEEKKPTN